MQAKDVTGPAGRALLDDYVRELHDRWTGPILNHPDPQPLGAGLAPPHGLFLIARVDGDLAGCVGLRTLTPGIGEIKCLFVRPRFRGHGLGRRLLTAVEEAARERGHAHLRLDTMAELVEARSLYADAGYRDIPPYTANPYIRY